jgi:hypothetical protein
MRSLLFLLVVTCVVADLVGWWGFEEGSGPIAYDSSPMKNHMVFTGRNSIGGVSNAFSNDGRVGRALNCNNANGWVYSYPLNDFTIMFWMKGNQAQRTGVDPRWYNGAGLFDGEQGGSHGDFGTALIGNRVSFGIGPNDNTFVVQDVNVVDNNWHHVAVTRSILKSAETTVDAIRIWVDGVKKVEDSTGTGNTATRDTPSLAIGGLATNINDQRFLGLIDQVKFYNHTLSDAEILFVYNSEKNGVSYVDIPSISAPSTSPSTNPSYTKATKSSSEPVSQTYDTKITYGEKPDPIKAEPKTVIALSVVGAFVGLILVTIIAFIYIYTKNKSYTNKKDKAEQLEHELEEKAKREAQNL